MTRRCVCRALKKFCGLVSGDSRKTQRHASSGAPGVDVGSALRAAGRRVASGGDIGESINMRLAVTCRADALYYLFFANIPTQLRRHGVAPAAYFFAQTRHFSATPPLCHCAASNVCGAVRSAAACLPRRFVVASDQNTFSPLCHRRRAVSRRYADCQVRRPRGSIRNIGACVMRHNASSITLWPARVTWHGSGGISWCSSTTSTSLCSRAGHL